MIFGSMVIRLICILLDTVIKLVMHWKPLHVSQSLYFFQTDIFFFTFNHELSHIHSNVISNTWFGLIMKVKIGKECESRLKVGTQMSLDTHLMDSNCKSHADVFHIKKP